jgi:hypothetical protein
VFGRLLILYDPSSTVIYKTTKIYEIEKKEQPILAYIDNTIKNLLIDFEFTKDSMMLIVLPSDIYEKILSEDTRKSLEQYRIEVELSDIEFLSEIIREYSGKCKDKLNENELSELASEVAKYEEGYTLIARLVGMELTKSGCNIDDIKRMIKESEYKASAFIAGFINKWFDVIDDKGQVNIKRINALADILTIRRPFAKSHDPGDPILTRGIIRLIEQTKGSEKEMSDEMVNWLTRRSHDLVENTIERLLNGEDLGEASKPWKRLVIKTNISKITNGGKAVKYFRKKYRKEFVKELKHFSGCWKRAALIIGSTLNKHLKLPVLNKEKYYKLVSKEYSASEVVDALNPCDIDDYLLVDNEIPDFVYELVTSLYISGSSPFTIIFANEYENAIKEAKKLLKIWRKRGEYYNLEAYYVLGLAFIVAEAVRLGKTINEDDADIILKVTLPAVKLTIYPTDYERLIIYPTYVKCILRALEPLRDKAPQQYLEILLEASQISLERSLEAPPRELEKSTVRFIYDELNYILSNSFDRLSELGWPLVTTVEVYSFILRNHNTYFTKVEKEDIVKSMCNLLNVLKKESNELATIAEAFTLIPAVEYFKFGDLISEYCSVNDLVTRVVEVRESLKELANKSDKLLKNKYFMNWGTFATEISQQEIREMITNIETLLTYLLAVYKLGNDELDEASKLFNEAAEVFKSIGSWENYINARFWFLFAGIFKAITINDYVNFLKLLAAWDEVGNEILENLSEEFKLRSVFRVSIHDWVQTPVMD